MSYDPYERKMVMVKDDFTSLPIYDAVPLSQLIEHLVTISKSHGDDETIMIVPEWSYDDVCFYITYERLETDEEYNKRIATYEKNKVTRDAKAAAKRAKEIEQLRKLKEKYPNE